MCSLKDDREYTISSYDRFWKRNEKTPAGAPSDVRRDTFDCENVLSELTVASKTYTLDQVSQTLYEVGGHFRRDR